MAAKYFFEQRADLLIKYSRAFPLEIECVALSFYSDGKEPKLFWFKMLYLVMTFHTESEPDLMRDVVDE